MSVHPIPVGDDSPSPISPIVLRLSLKGQPIQSYRFDKHVVTVGRDPHCDVWVDNPGVSRQQLRLEWTALGEWRIEDSGSSNGSFLNERPVRAASLRSGDSVQFAKYALEVEVEDLVGGGASNPSLRHRSADGATVMLSPSEVRQLVQDTQSPKSYSGVPALHAVPPAEASCRSTAGANPSQRSASPGWLPWAVALVALAAVATWWFRR
jgi:pSer/pThr/pTyr-binding forkhead associated (FHA) protein